MFLCGGRLLFYLGKMAHHFDELFVYVQPELSHIS